MEEVLCTFLDSPVFEPAKGPAQKKKREIFFFLFLLFLFSQVVGFCSRWVKVKVKVKKGRNPELTVGHASWPKNLNAAHTEHIPSLLFSFLPPPNSTLLYSSTLSPWPFSEFTLLSWRSWIAFANCLLSYLILLSRQGKVVRLVAHLETSPH